MTAASLTPRTPYQLRWTAAYAALVIGLGAWLNYTQPYGDQPLSHMGPWAFGLWAALYVPLLVWPVWGGWTVKEFGFALTPAMAAAVFLFPALCFGFSGLVQPSGLDAFSTAFARLGEEVFFRGFLLAGLLRVFADRKRPWLWAALVSSLLYTLTLTQVLNPVNHEFFSLLSTPHWVVVLERLLNVFALALFLALICLATQSVLPSALMHAVSTGGPGSVLFVCLLYLLILYWVHQRGEKVLSLEIGFTRTR